MKKWLCLCVCLLAAMLAAEELQYGDYKFDFKPDKADAIYRCGEEIRFSGNVLVKGKTPENMTVQCKILRDGLWKSIVNKKVVVSDKPIEFTVKLDKPGWVQLLVYVLDEKGAQLKMMGPKKRITTVYGGTGALVEPEKIVAGGPEPADFDAFWAAKRAELDKVPVKELEKVEVPAPAYDAKTVVCYDVKIACAGGKPVSGYLCLPRDAKPKSLPAIVTYHGAGVYSANKPSWLARSGMIALDVNAHGIENGKDAKFYSDLNVGELKDYRHFGKDDREKIYFVGMFLRVMRALDYVKSLPEWDGRTLIVMGGSQGGGQSLAAAALDKQVTHCIAHVPAICDHAGVLAGRAAGWPRFCNEHPDGKFTDREKKVLQETAYVDCAFMARRIKADAYLCTGLIDNTCIPNSVFAAYNGIPAGTKKAMSITPNAGHDAKNIKGMAWLNEYRKSLQNAKK